MNHRIAIVVLLAAILTADAIAGESKPDPARDILVTFADEGQSAIGTGISEPYRKRKRYAMDTAVRRHAADIAREYALVEVDRWPIESLSVFCFVFRTSPGVDRDAVIERLRADARIESVQALQQFETLAGAVTDYDDTYAALQRALDVMEIPAAHRYSRGQGVRVAIIDSRADTEHEDLEGRVTETRFIEDSGSAQHGTAVVSVIGANANNAVGIVGVAPESVLELYAACWSEAGPGEAVCNSFTLAKALDATIASTPDVLNLSLIGPHDPLLARLLREASRAGVIIVAARSPQNRRNTRFPASLDFVISVGSGDTPPAPSPARADGQPRHQVYAPGRQIMVAMPDNAYDFRSGSSLAAAHVSGVIALLLAVSPEMPREAVQAYLRQSQRTSPAESTSVNACLALQLLDDSRKCRGRLPPAVRTRT